MDDALFTSCVYAAQTLHSKASSAPIYGYLFSYKGLETPSYAAAFGELVRRSGFDHPMIASGSVTLERKRKEKKTSSIHYFKVLLMEMSCFTCFEWLA